MDIASFFRILFKLGILFGILSFLLLFMTERGSVEFTLVLLTFSLNGFVVLGIVVFSKWDQKRKNKK